MVVRAEGLAAAGLALPGIGSIRPAEKCRLADADVAAPGQADGQLRLADEALVGEILARAGDAFDAEIALEVVLDFGNGARFTGLRQVLDDGREDRGGALAEVLVDGRESGLHGRPGLTGVEEAGVDEPEKSRIQF